MFEIKEIDREIEEYIKEMTLEEKCLQMLHSAPAIERLGIKKYNWWNESLHGVARAGTSTLFPQAIGLAAIFDEKFMETLGDAISTEARGKFNMQQKFQDFDIYKGLTFWAPNINIFRDPRWGRGHETYGEDPFLTSRVACGFIKGLQGSKTGELKVAAGAKHFAVHSGPESLRHEFNAEVSLLDLAETYLPAFKVCVKEAGVETVMGAYNRVNGEPCCGSELLLKKTLRDSWNFKGHVVSDCWAIKDFYEHHKITSSAVESVELAVKSGCDLNCGNLFHYLPQAVREGYLEEKEIDQAVKRLFRTRKKLGALTKEDFSSYDSIDFDVVDSKEMKELNLKASERSLVLLKNENNILPLDKKKIKTLGIIGPNAENVKALVGNYEGTASRYYTVNEGIQDYVQEEIRVLFSRGCDLTKDRVENLAMEGDRFSEVRGICEKSDVIVACVGLDASLEGEEGDEGNAYESGDKPDLNLPKIQIELLKILAETKKTVILIVLSGSALYLEYAHENFPAIIQAWYPGSMGGKALARILFGECCPEGKLPVTFYRTDHILPKFEDYSMKERTYRYIMQEPFYPFGYGLSYSRFIFSDISMENEIVEGKVFEITGFCENTGNYDANVTIQIYIKAEQIGPPNPSLKGIQKIHIEKEKKIFFRILIKPEQFSFADKTGTFMILPGKYEVWVGDQQPDQRSEELTGKKVDKRIVIAKKEQIFDRDFSD